MHDRPEDSPVQLRKWSRPIFVIIVGATLILFLCEVYLFVVSCKICLLPSFQTIVSFSAERTDAGANGSAQHETESQEGANDPQETMRENAEGRTDDQSAGSSLTEPQKRLVKALGLKDWPPLARNVLIILYGTDQSSITPFLLCQFTFHILLAAIWCSTKKLHRALAPAFPFPRDFALHYVQFGLIGTLWGFMLLGFSLQERAHNAASQQSIEMLVIAFGTALVSTFAGVVLAYMLAPMVQRLFSWLLIYRGDSNEEESSREFVAWMERTVAALRSTANLMETNEKGLTDGFRELTAKLDEAAQKVHRIFGEPCQTVKSFQTDVAAIKKSVDELTKEWSEVDRTRLLGHLDSIDSAIGAYAEAAQRREDAQTKVAVNALKTIVSGLEHHGNR